MACHLEGKQQTLAYGGYPNVALAETREKRDSAERLLSDGVDPSRQVKAEKMKQQVSSASTFNAVADEFLANAG